MENYNLYGYADPNPDNEIEIVGLEEFDPQKEIRRLAEAGLVPKPKEKQEIAPEWQAEIDRLRWYGKLPPEKKKKK